jgi:AsmA-like C-terminal region
LTASSASSASTGHQRDLDLDFAVNILTGHNDEVLTNATIKASTRNRELRQLQLAGRFRSAPVSAQTTRRARGAPVLVLQSEDAGATLRFADIYKRMIGGALTLQASLGDTPQVGTVSVESFALRNEPALRRIAAEQPAATMPAGSPASRLEGGEVAFTRLRAEFTRAASRIEFRDAVIAGMQVGFTLGGWIDYGRDRADIAGTFVPAYGLNNVFAQVPLVGPLLGGGENEGLFAVNFRVSGAATSPTLTVNPLSAVAPGFLRKLFGAGDAASAAPPQQTER